MVRSLLTRAATDRVWYGCVLSSHGESWAKYNLAEPIPLRSSSDLQDNIRWLHDHHTSISIGGKPIYNRRNEMGGTSGKRQNVTNRFVERTRAYGMEVSTENSKIMTNITNDICADISMNG